MAVFGEQQHDPAVIAEAFRLREVEHLSIRLISQATGIPHSTLGDYLKGVGECFYERPCRFCGEIMFASHAHKRYCGDRCKHMWLWRNSEAYREKRNRSRKRAYLRRKGLL